MLSITSDFFWLIIGHEDNTQIIRSEMSNLICHFGIIGAMILDSLFIFLTYILLLKYEHTRIDNIIIQ